MGRASAIYFPMSILIVEMIYVRVPLVTMHNVTNHERLMKSQEWVTLLVVVALSIFSFVAAANENAISQNVFLSYGLPGFVSGMFMSALNLAQIPFWFEWSIVLFPRKILLPKILITIYTLQAYASVHSQVVYCKIKDGIVGSLTKHQSAGHQHEDRKHFYT